MCLLQAFVVVGDHNGHVGLGVKCAKEVRQQAAGVTRLVKQQVALAAVHSLHLL